MSVGSENPAQAQECSSMQPIRDLTINYRIKYEELRSGTKFTHSVDFGELCAPKDFLTFIFASGNDNVRRELQSSLQTNGLITDLNGSNIACSLSSTFSEYQQPQINEIVDEIRKCVLSIQGELEFYQQEWTRRTQSLLASIQNSEAVKRKSLFVQLYEKSEPQSLEKEWAIWLVFEKSCQNEIDRYTSQFASVYEVQSEFLHHVEPMSQNEGLILLKLGLEHAISHVLQFQMEIQLTDKGLQFTFPQQEQEITCISRKISQVVNTFKSSVTRWDEKVHISQLDVLRLHKVAEGLQEALSGLQVYLDVDFQQAFFQIYARAEDLARNTIRIIKENLVEQTLPVTPDRKLMLEQDGWRNLMDAVKRNGTENEFVIEQNDAVIVVTGLKENVEKVVGHIGDLTHAIASQDVEMKEVNEDATVVTEKLSVRDSNRLIYLQKFLSISDMGSLQITVPGSQTIVLKGSKEDVKKAKQVFGNTLSSIHVKTIPFSDNGYLSIAEGQEFLKAVENDAQVLCRVQNDEMGAQKASMNKKGDKQRACHKKASFSWEVDKNCLVKLVVAKAEDLAADVIIEVMEEKVKKGNRSCSFTFVKKDKYATVCLSLPHWHPSKEVDEAHEKIDEIFEKVVRSELTVIAVSIDYTASCALGSFLPLLLRSFRNFIKEADFKKSRQRLTLIFCSTVDRTVAEAKKMCDKKLGSRKELEMPRRAEGLPITVQIVQGKLHETKADVLVNTIPADKDLSHGQVSRALLHKAGDGMQAEMYQKYGYEYCDNEIFKTGGYKLPCSHVLHGVLMQYPGRAEDSRTFYEESVYGFVTSCLIKADRLGCRSIAFPAIGTGRLQYPPEIVASSLFLAVTEFSDKYPDTSIEEVTVVVFPADIDAIAAFTREEDEMKARMVKQSDRDSMVAVQLVGLEENIAKARQLIECKLDTIKADSSGGQTTANIDGVSQITYEVLKFFHADVLFKFEQQGCECLCEGDVLTIEAGSKEIQVIKAEIEQCLCLIKDLAKAEMSVQDFDISKVEKQIDKRKNNEILHILDQENEKVFVFGKAQKTVETEVAQLNALICIPEVSTNSIRNTGRSKENKTFSQSIKGSKVDQKGLVKETGRARPNVEKAYVENIPFELYMAMKEIDSEMFKKPEVSYDRHYEEIAIQGSRVKFNTLLEQVRHLQSQAIPLEEDMKIEDKADRIGKVICVYNKDESTITVFAPDMKSVQDKVHQIKVDFGMVERSDRASRHLSESFQIPNSPKGKDQQKQNYSEGARPKQIAGHVHTSTSAIPNFERFFTNENIPVMVYTQNILHLRVDCIVNAANDSLKHGGGIAEVISKAAGSKLDRDCNDYVRRNGPLKVGGAFVSVPGNLPYKCVIHAVGPRWSDYKPYKPDDVTRCQRDLFMAVLNSFLKAEEKGMKSIAVPAISSAVFKVPIELCVKMYAAAVLAYSKQSAASKTRLTEIHFVDKKVKVIQLIQDEFRKQIPHGIIPDFLQKKSSPPKHSASSGATGVSHSVTTKGPESKITYPYPYCAEKTYDDGFGKESLCHFSGTLQLIVRAGTMFDAHYASVDAAVCSEDKNGYGSGYTSKTLLSRGGNKYRTAKEAAFRVQPKFGDVVCCKGDMTGFKKVLHTVMWLKNDKDTHDQRCEKFRKMFKTVLHTAVKEGCKAIVMPLLFTGQGNVPTDFCTERLLDACMAFSSENKASKLTVYLVNKEHDKTDTIKRVMQNYVGLQTALRQSKQAPRQSKQAPQRPPNPQLTTGNRDAGGGHRKPASNFTRSQTDRSQPGRHGDVGRMSSSFTSMNVGSSDDHRSSGTRIYDDDDDDNDNDDDDDMDSQGPSWESNNDHNETDAKDENCVICMDTVNKPKKLKCGHVFCTDCIDSYFSSCKKVCPTCGVVCGVIKGDQPHGRMNVRFDRNFHCAGFEGVGTHVITYSFDPGKQGADHPNPGRPYKGITRTAFLPDTREGREVLKMLEVAFDRKLVFTIGSSRTTGQEGVITWNDIHHKTNPKPNTPFGYPDDGYLDRVKDELAVKGVTPDDIPASHLSK